MAATAFCSFLDRWARQEIAEAVAVLRAAERADGLDPSIALLFDAIILYVEQQTPHSGEAVYIDNADAFELFVSTGGNVRMYEAIDVALHDAWYNNGSGGSSRNSWSLLDVGTGGGLGLLPALSRTANVADRHLPAVLELVEPSMPMLTPAVQQITQLLQKYSLCRSAPLLPDVDHAAGAAKHSPTELRVHNLTLQELIDRHDQQTSRWDVCQATFSLQSLPPLDRRRGLAWLAERCSRLLLVEFDVDQARLFRPIPMFLCAPSGWSII
jgi:hypothetical protein